MTVPRARQRAVGRAAAARAEDNTRSNKDADVEANRQALKRRRRTSSQACGTPRRRDRWGPGSPWGSPLWRRGHLGPGRREIGGLREQGRQGPRRGRSCSGHRHKDPPHGPCQRWDAEPPSVARVRPAKNPGERTGRKRCQFLLGPQASTELFGPTGGGIATKTHRTAHAGGGGSGAPKCCRSCLGRRVAEKLRGDDRAKALAIFYWAPKRRRSRLQRWRPDARSRPLLAANETGGGSGTGTVPPGATTRQRPYRR